VLDGQLDGVGRFPADGDRGGLAIGDGEPGRTDEPPIAFKREFDVEARARFGRISRGEREIEGRERGDEH